MSFEESWEKMPHRESDYIKVLCRGFYNEAIDEAVKIVMDESGDWNSRVILTALAEVREKIKELKG